MHSNFIVFVILGILFAAVGLHLVLYTRRRAAVIRRFAQSRGYIYKARDDGALEAQLGDTFGIEKPGFMRTFGQIGDIVSLSDGTIFRAVELMDLNPNASAVNPHHTRAAILFSVQCEWTGIFHVTPDLAVRQRYPLDKESIAPKIRQFIQHTGMPPPPHPLSLTLMGGYGLAYLEPPVVGSVTQKHLEYLEELSAHLSHRGAS